MGVQSGWTDGCGRVATGHVSGAPAGVANPNCSVGRKREKTATMVRTALRPLCEW